MANAPTAAQTASGFAINIINTANTAFEGSHVHSKKERANLDAHQRSLLFEQATTKLPNGVKFVPLPATINDPKQLSTFSSVDSTIQVFVERLQAFDLRDVFYLLTVLDMNNHKAEEEEDPNNPGVKRLKMIDLLTDYANVSVAQVATSNQFYHLWTDNAVDQMHTNLNWSYYLLKNNIDPLLMSRLQPKYDAFPVSQRGGPLLFALLMAELLYTNESAVQTLKDQIEKYKINKVPGEDIKKISSVILSVAKRIWYSKGECFPENFVDTIISLLQTSSVPSFNEQYKTIALTRASDKAKERVAVTSGAAAPTGTYQNDLATVERLLNMAATFYDGYTRDGTWNTHVKTKHVQPVQSSSTDAKPAAALVTGTCFNCGSKDHMLPDCPKPTDSRRISANKQKYMDAKKQAKANHRGPSTTPANGTSNTTQPAQNGARTQASNNNGSSQDRPSKWAPPREGGPQQRFIWTRTHGNQPYQFNSQTQRWDMMVPIPASNQGANAGASGTLSTSSTVSSSNQSRQSKSPAAANTASNGNNTADLRAQMAELQRQMEALNAQL